VFPGPPYIGILVRRSNLNGNNVDLCEVHAVIDDSARDTQVVNGV
jgi:hypothetical protein